MPDLFTISDLAAYIRQRLEVDDALSDTWVEGEVSNMTRARSGHWYFTLKDSAAQLRCVMWKGNAARQFVVPEEGDHIVVHGYVSFYDQRGDLQFYADFIRAAGAGDLYSQFEALKERLSAEGLFDALHKQPLPAFPLRIGVVTSSDAAALQDVLNVLRRRLPLAEVVLSLTRVQGADAPPLIAQALTQLDELGAVDVILLVRGGGSIEDLWAFNDEQVARAIFAARTPVVTGVGHETDFTIVDFVADQRAPTPSAAAEVVSPDLSELREGLRLQRGHLARLAVERIRVWRERADNAARSLRLMSPASTIRNGRQRVDEMRSRLDGAQASYAARLRERLRAKQQALAAASPAAILRRGYAIVRHREDGVLLRADAEPGTAIRITLADGELNGRIEEQG